MQQWIQEEGGGGGLRLPLVFRPKTNFLTPHPSLSEGLDLPLLLGLESQLINFNLIGCPFLLNTCKFPVKSYHHTVKRTQLILRLVLC